MSSDCSMNRLWWFCRSRRRRGIRMADTVISSRKRQNTTILQICTKINKPMNTLLTSICRWLLKCFITYIHNKPHYAYHKSNASPGWHFPMVLRLLESKRLASMVSLIASRFARWMFVVAEEMQSLMWKLFWLFLAHFRLPLIPVSPKVIHGKQVTYMLGMLLARKRKYSFEQDEYGSSSSNYWVYRN